MATRVEKTRAKMRANGIDNLIIVDPFNLQYLADFGGLAGDGCMVINDDEAVLITDARYEIEMGEKQLDDVQVVINSNYYGEAVKHIKSGSKNIGFEDRMPFAIYDKINQLVDVPLVSQHDLIEKIRVVKDETEIAKIQKACDLVSQAYEELLKYVQVGMTEKQVSFFLHEWLVNHGAQKPSFDTIVASGYRSALPHGDATDKKLAPNELVTIDFGFYYQGYTSDMTRTFAIGDPGEELKHAYEVVYGAQKAMIAAMVDGVDGKDVDAAARKYIDERGYGKEFNHGSGHSIGLDIHENPVTNRSCKDKLYNGFIMTAEPGIYIANKGGIRIEDDVLITPEGPKVLTSASKELIIL